MTSKKIDKAKKADFLTKTLALGKSVLVKIDGLDMDVFVKPLSAAALQAITQSCLHEGKKATDEDAFDEDALVLHVTAASVVDAAGQRLVPPGSEQELRARPAFVYNPLQTAALRVNGMAEPRGN